ncbi:MAG: redoxin domain-containing protein [Actinobacteria bacterium]|nr:redoxin domain-containing protein [Actinomycetota bacterium]
MALLIAFSFVAGAATALSPCVLPVLPLALSAGATGGHRRPLGVVTGLAVSFTFATVGLVYVINALGLPDSLLRTLAIVVLALFGIALLVPSVAARVEAWLSGIAARRAGPGRGDRRSGEGFLAGVVVGLSLGFVYAPCAGPILAGVITVSASQSFTAGRLATALAYGIGSAVALYVLIVAGRRVTRRLSARAIGFQQAMGAVMVIVAGLMLFNLDTRFETAVASDLPSFLVDPAHRLESGHDVSSALARVRGRGRVATAAGAAEAARGSSLPVLGDAPAIVGTQRWFNTPGGRGLTLAGLRARHRVVLIDFWTYSCINCLRTLPYVKAWDRRYVGDGLTVIGVHTPEFPFERSASNVASAIAQNGIRYPVVQDNNDATWNAFGNQYWPAKYLIDDLGRVRYVHFGEGDYGLTEAAIRSLLREAGARRLGATTSVRAEQASAGATTPESYLGAERAERFANGTIEPGDHDYGGGTPSLAADELAYRGRWSVGATSAQAGDSAQLYLRFDARRVFLVLGSPGRRRTLRVLLDGHPLPDSKAGSDVHLGAAGIEQQRLYRLVDLRHVGDHLLTLLFDPGIRGYAFTFG